MIRAPLVLCPLLLAGCGGDLSGDWSGSCSLSADGRDVDLDFVATLEADGESPSGGQVYTGSLAVADSEVAYLAQLTDEESGATLSAAGTDPAASGDNTSVFYLVITGSLDGGSLVGTGEYWTEITADGEAEASRRYSGSCTVDQGA